jgi:hypothetical protein
VEKTGILHNGITIKVICNPRNYVAGKFKASLVVSLSNTILIEVPSMRFSKLNESEKYIAGKAVFQIDCARA